MTKRALQFAAVGSTTGNSLAEVRRPADDRLLNADCHLDNPGFFERC
jgi:hypothetical protein